MRACIAAVDFRRQIPPPNYFDKRRQAHTEFWWKRFFENVHLEGQEGEDRIT
jgi:hypothetical protein